MAYIDSYGKAFAAPGGAPPKARPLRVAYQDALRRMHAGKTDAEAEKWANVAARYESQLYGTKYQAPPAAAPPEQLFPADMAAPKRVPGGYYPSGPFQTVKTGGGRPSNSIADYYRQQFASMGRGAADPSGQTASKRANIERLGSILSMYSQMGQAEEARIGRATRQGQARGRQSLINRGLGSSTVVGPMMNRIQETANLGYLDLADRVAGRIGGVLERVTDEPMMPTGTYLDMVRRINAAGG